MQRASRDFIADLQKVGGPVVSLQSDSAQLKEFAVIIGTLGHSHLIDDVWVRRGLLIPVGLPPGTVI